MSLSVAAARAEALFVSPLQATARPSLVQVREAVAAAVRRHGVRGCAGGVAAEYGRHPEAAAERMRWARTAVT